MKPQRRRDAEKKKNLGNNARSAFVISADIFSLRLCVSAVNC